MGFLRHVSNAAGSEQSRNWLSSSTNKTSFKPHQAAFWRSFHIYSVLSGNNDPNMVDLFSAIAQNHRNHNQNLR
nr:MAG TPA: hypothetical protein [Caudoviricetes sp.]